MKIKDDVCKFCPLLNTCKSKDLCAPLSWVDGNLKRKEPLIRDLSKASIDFEYSNYNEVLSELIMDAGQKSKAAINRIKAILLIQDYRLRGIGAMMLFNVSKEEICRLLNISISQLNRIIKQ